MGRSPSGLVLDFRSRVAATARVWCVIPNCNVGGVVVGVSVSIRNAKCRFGPLKKAE